MGVCRQPHPVMELCQASQKSQYTYNILWPIARKTMGERLAGGANLSCEGQLQHDETD